MTATALSIKKTYQPAETGQRSVLRLFTDELQGKIKGAEAGGAASAQTSLVACERARAMPLPDSIGRGLSPQERNAFGHYIAGITDGEGCFALNCGKMSRRGVEYHRCGARFSITLRQDDTAILQQLLAFFNCGKLYHVPSRATTSPQTTFSVTDIDDLVRKIIPAFDLFPLRTRKVCDYSVWKKGVQLLHEVKHRPRIGRPCGKDGRGRGQFPRWTENDLQRFLSIYSDLTDGKRYTAVKQSFSAVAPPLENFHSWLAGFVDGEGCFYLNISKGISGKGLPYQRCAASFQITLRSDDSAILEIISSILDCGTVRKVRRITNRRRNPETIYRVSSTDDLLKKVVPIFVRHPLQAKKRFDFILWKKAVQYMHKIQYSARISDGRRFYSKWTDDDIQTITQWSNELKVGRQYKGGTV